jgi:hypothetical protein
MYFSDGDDEAERYSDIQLMREWAKINRFQPFL